MFAFRSRFRFAWVPCAIGFGWAAAFGAESGSTGRPNVLFIICDDLNDSVDRMGGHPDARTPNVDRLMQQGVRFTNAQCSAPLCGPSRASLLTGLYPSTTGYYGYQQGRNHWRKNAVMKEARTMMEHFREHGYDVYGTGKLFHNGQEDWSVWKRDGGFGVRPDFGPFPWDGRVEGEGDVPRWKDMTSHPGMPEPLRSAVRWRSFGPLSDVPEYKPDPARGVPGHKGWLLGGKAFRYVSEEDRDPMPDELNAEWAVQLLKQQHDRPFFLAVGFNRPHTPMYAPKPYFDMFPTGRLQLPPYRKNDLADCARVLWQIPEGRSPYVNLPGRYGFEGFELLQQAGGEAMWKRWIQAYLACVAFVDDQLGKILDGLASSSHARDTIVIFTSDHGYHMGEKDYVFKNSVWEESARVPLVVLAPGVSKANSECAHPVSLVDVYPTLIDLCGIPGHPNDKGNGRPLDGHSIRPFLDDPANGQWLGPPVALTAVAGIDPLEVNEPGSPERQHFSVRSKRYRYILCNDGSEELYDHRHDPHEWTNIAADSKHAKIKQELREELLKLTGRK